ncbi:MAG TPA: PAS domain S-box protein, partial [Methanobacterium sp.]|nr:PAS domain S-box protein [Methanobacterium sp.]
NRRVTEVLPLQDVAELIQIYGNVALTGESTSFETFVPTLNRFYEIEAFSSYNREFTVVFSDITQRKKADEKIQRLANLVESSSDAILTKSIEGNIISWNKGAEQVYGYYGEEVLGKHISILEPYQIKGETEKLINEIKNGKKIDNYETIRLKKDSEVIYVSINLSPVIDTSGKLVAISTISRDITKRKLAEEQNQKLLEQTQLFAEELESSNEELRVTTDELLVANEELRNKTEELQISNERFKLLSAAARTILSSETPERIVETICKKVMDYLDCDVFFNYLLNEKEQRLHLNAYSGVPEETRKSIEWLDLGIAVCGCVARDNNRIIAENVQETSDERTELVKSFGIKAYACHPIISNERTIGTLSFGTKSRSHFTENELELMRTVTNYVATAMERKIREEEVTRARDDWESTFDAVPDLIVLLDHEHKVIRANDAMAAKLGVTPEECIGLPCYRAVHGTDEPPSFCPHSKLLEDGCEHTTEVHEENLGGNFIVSVAPLHSSDKKLMGSVHVAHDITKRKEAENTILKAKEQTELDRKRLETILETTPSAVIIVEASDGRISYINRRAKQIYGIDISGSDLASVITKVKSRMVDGSKYPVGEGPSSRALKGETVLNEEMIIEQPDGTTIPIMGSTAPIFDSEGKVTAAVAIFEDITDRKKAEKEREITVEFLRIVNESTRTHDLIQSVTTFFQQQSGCEAVGIRLHEGEDYPYYEARGFPKEFILLENELCARNKDGEIIRDDKSNPIMECMCGNVICGRFDPSQEFFTANGSFWTNCTTELLASTSEDDRQARTRNRCNGEGYESVALIPLHIGKQQLGLLQLNDRKKGIFSPEIIALWERLADYLSVALAKYKAEEALQVSEKKYRGIIENIQDGYFRLDKEGKIIMASPSLAEMYGFGSSQEMIGITAAPLYKNIEDREQMLGELNKQGKLDDYEIEAVKGNDSFWASVNAQFYYDNKGQIQGIEGFTRDITLRKKSEEELKQRSALLNISYEAFFSWEYDKGILSWNKGAERLYGFSENETIGKISHDLLKTEHPTEFNEFMEKLYKEKMWTGELIHTTKNGSKLIVESRQQLIQDSSGKKIVIETNRDITKRKEAESALKESEERYYNLFKDNHAVMLLIEPETGKIVDSNSAADSFYGYTQEEMLKININDINILEDKNVFSQMQKAQSRDKRRFVFKHRLSNGEIRDVSVYSGPLNFGNKVLLYSIIHDITEQKMAEEALKESEEKFSKAFNDNPAAMTLSDDKGRWMDVNESFVELTGYNKDELVGHTSAELNLINTEKRKQIITELQEKGTMDDSEFEIQTKSGERRVILSKNEKIEFGSEIRFLTFIYDITERKKAEEALIQSEERYRSIIENIQDAYFRGDNEGKIVMASNSAANMFGFDSPEEIIGFPVSSVYKNSEDRDFVLEELNKHGKLDNNEIEVLKKDGTSFWVSQNAQFYYNDQGQIQGTEAFARDITERKRAENVLQTTLNR